MHVQRIIDCPAARFGNTQVIGSVHEFLRINTTNLAIEKKYLTNSGVRTKFTADIIFLKLAGA